MAIIIGTRTIPTKNWFYHGFLARHPDVRMDRPKKRDNARAALTQETGDAYFAELGKRLDDIGIKNRCDRICNMDETGVSLDHSPPKVLCSVKDRAEMVTHGKSPNTTLLSCVNAAGDTLPPYLVIKGKTIPNDLKNGAMPGTVFTVSETDWSNSVIFKDWFDNHFKKHIPPARPVILFYDGHTTHYNVEIIVSAMLERIHLFVFPHS